MSPDLDTGWYYSIDEVSYGPVSRKELLSYISSGKLTPQTYVWHSGFGRKWRPLYEVSELDVRVNLEGTYGTSGSDCSTARPSYAVPTTPPLRMVIADAYRWMVKALFKNSTLLAWICIAFTFWLGATNISVLSLDTRHYQKCAELSHSHFGTILLCLRETQDAIFGKIGFLTWAITLTLTTIFMTYFKVRGRIMSLHLLHFPHDPLKSAWKRCNGITRSLVYFHVILDIVETTAVSFAAWKLLNALDTEVLASGSFANLKEAVSGNQQATRLLLGGVGVFFVAEVVKSFVYHFAEPIVYGRGVSVLTAMRAAWRFCRYNLFSTLKFFIFILVFNLLFLAVVITLILLLCFVLASMGINNVSTLGSIMMFTLLPGKILLLPVYYFIRALGPKMLGVL